MLNKKPNPSSQGDRPGLLWKLWEQTRARRGSQIAITSVADGRTWSFDDLHRAVEGRRLVQASPVACESGNTVDFVVAFLAARRAGRPFLALEPSLQPAEKQKVIRQLRAATLPKDTAMLKLTSGSLEIPKTVALSETNLLADGRNFIATMNIRPEDVTLGAVSLVHSYGFTVALLPLLMQGTPLVLMDSLYPRGALDAIGLHRVTLAPLVPVMFDTLGELAGDWSSVRLCISAGALLTREVAMKFYRKTHRKIHTLYGSTECGGICFDRSETPCLPEGCVGTPLEGVHAELAPDRRIRVRSDAVALGYLSQNGDGVLDRSQFLTGDLGRFDRAGRLFLCGRVAGVINVAGRKVHPTEIERCLMQMAGLKATAVVSLPDRRRGETIGALVVSATLTESAVLTHCRQHLASWKVPRVVRIVDRLPVNSRGKIERSAVRELLA